MSGTLSTTVSPTQRTISVLLESGEIERVALHETRDGDLYWRRDTYAGIQTGAAWLAHGGRLTVGQVLALVPACAKHVIAWTEEEIETGSELPDADVFVRASRADALRRLGAELTAAIPAAA
jgi:hypothetical protein